MSFTLSKVLWALAAPDAVLLMLLVIGLLLLAAGRRRVGGWLAGLATAGFIALAVVPIGPWMLRVLEDRFPIPAELPARVDGVIVLGGAVVPLITAERGQAALNEAAERMTVLPALAARYPNAILLFTGGSGLLLDQDVKEAPVAQAAWADMGFDTERIVFEAESRNTWENAVFSRELVKPADGSRWLLVTSAAHMPRSVGVFRRGGWNVVPYPVDFTVSDRQLRRPGPGLAPGLMATRLAVREYVGLAAYRLMGRTDSLFPAPAEPGVTTAGSR